MLSSVSTKTHAELYLVSVRPSHCRLWVPLNGPNCKQAECQAAEECSKSICFTRRNCSAWNHWTGVVCCHFNPLRLNFQCQRFTGSLPVWSWAAPIITVIISNLLSSLASDLFLFALLNLYFVWFPIYFIFSDLWLLSFCLSLFAPVLPLSLFGSHCRIPESDWRKPFCLTA